MIVAHGGLNGRSFSGAHQSLSDGMVSDVRLEKSSLIQVRCCSSSSGGRSKERTLIPHLPLDDDTKSISHPRASVVDGEQGVRLLRLQEAHTLQLLKKLTSPGDESQSPCSCAVTHHNELPLLGGAERDPEARFFYEHGT
eukprot:3633194-Amphidinium_carterae.2